MISPEKLASMIDHTNIKPDASVKDINNLCNDAMEYNFSSACVTPTNVALAHEILESTDVNVCSVIGFPFGANKSEIKAFEALVAVEDGAVELDMVMNIGALKSCADSLVKRDIEGVVESADGMVVKVILETALLTNSEKIRACNISKEAGADYIKTSTGIGYPGANIQDISLIRETVGQDMGVKASGGIRNLNTVLDMINAGASKIGTSTGPAIMKELEKNIHK
ncbi:deoxyribose-phosphate aldolase [Methanobacterium sp. SMA-27]|uniref:deoxyribose-phosphate aldolase n=1 Tax=Methanobacterium sp. SMA-27 TaxID=1495336 RepID=UPI000A4BF904|nr:deoxyribose-phosphate aldolase [Methanobacterium sp. SMA-27]